MSSDAQDPIWNVQWVIDMLARLDVRDQWVIDLLARLDVREFREAIDRLEHHKGDWSDMCARLEKSERALAGIIAERDSFFRQFKECRAKLDVAESASKIHIIQSGQISDLHAVLDAAMDAGCRGAILITLRRGHECNWDAKTKGSISMPEICFIGDGLSKLALDSTNLTVTKEG